MRTYFIYNSNDEIKFMRIRILEPIEEDWYYIIYDSSIKKYRISKKGETMGNYSSSLFINLDVGHVGGLMFIRGFYKKDKSNSKYKYKDIVDWHDSKTQAIRIEYSSLDIDEFASDTIKIKKALKKYKIHILNFLNQEYNKEIIDLKIEPKGIHDFKLILIK